MKHTKILVIDDDAQIIHLLKTSLSVNGWHVLAARNGADGLKAAEEESPSLVILDMMMPVMDGFEVCRRLRQWSRVPIIALSARSSREDKVRCLKLGADDYITKPFGVDELIARIQGVLRRCESQDAPTQEAVLICDAIKIDLARRMVFVDGNEARLTPTEYKLLEELATNAGKTMTYTELLGKIWGPEFTGDRDYLYVHIKHLRDKLEADPKNHRHIIDVPRVGYRFERELVAVS